MRACAYLFVFISLFGVVGCASTGEVARDVPVETPLERAYGRALDAREQALDSALEESESQRSYSVIVRHNPGRCGAPNQEIFVRGRWERVALTGKNERATSSLETWLDTAKQEPLTRSRILGKWDERVWTSPGGVQWPVFEVAQFDGLVAERDQRSSGESGISDGEWLAARCAGAGSRSTP